MDLDVARRLRRRTLEAHAASPEVVDEALRYCESPFSLEQTCPAPVLPQADEPHVADWRAYAAEAGADPLRYLQGKLPQLGVPIVAGVSASEAYRAVSRRGEAFDERDFGGRLQLAAPLELKLHIHEHPAGALPVLATPNRADFEALSRAFAFRSEPEPISPAVNARMIAGFINWDRVHRYRAVFEAENGPQAWPEEMKRVAKSEPWRFHDRLMLTCARPYSAVSAADLGLDMDEARWLEVSDRLRTEHEFTHYATRRVFGSMSLNLLDETLCDLMGMTHALGRFEAAAFLRFMGLEAFPQVRQDGRLSTYTSELSAAGRQLVAAVTVQAARRLEALWQRHGGAAERVRMLLALAPLPLDLLASEEGEAAFAQSWEHAGRLLQPTSVDVAGSR